MTATLKIEVQLDGTPQDIESLAKLQSAMRYVFNSDSSDKELIIPTKMKVDQEAMNQITTYLGATIHSEFDRLAEAQAHSNNNGQLIANLHNGEIEDMEKNIQSVISLMEDLVSKVDAMNHNLGTQNKRIGALEDTVQASVEQLGLLSMSLTKSVGDLPQLQTDFLTLNHSLEELASSMGIDLAAHQEEKEDQQLREALTYVENRASEMEDGPERKTANEMAEALRLALGSGEVRGEAQELGVLDTSLSGEGEEPTDEMLQGSSGQSPDPEDPEDDEDREGEDEAEDNKPIPMPDRPLSRFLQLFLASKEIPYNSTIFRKFRAWFYQGRGGAHIEPCDIDDVGTKLYHYTQQEEMNKALETWFRQKGAEITSE